MNYEKPKLELIKFDVNNVICTSNPTPPTYGGWSGDNDETDFQ